MENSVTLTIDGVEVSVPKGTLIVEAAKRIENEIPVFCYHAKMDPVGMCRMCLVDVGTPARNRATGELELDENGEPVIRFFPKPMTACTTPVSEGMVVKVNSESALTDRKAVLEFLLTSHPLDCPVCDKGGECPLQDLTIRHGPGNSRFDYEDKQHFPKKYPLGDLIVLDMERCILCARCTRFQQEIAFDPVLAIEQRGRQAHIVSYSDPPFDSHYSGNTADICPVGALTTRDFRFKARAWEMTNTPSVCNHCGVGCNTVLGTRSGTIRRIMPRQNELVNEVWICDKGRFGHHYNGSPNRLVNPLVKKDGEFVETSWGEALKMVAENFNAIKSADGVDALGGIAGARLTNEDLYVFQKLFRDVIGTNNIDHRIGLSAALQDDSAQVAGVGVDTDLGQLGQNDAILVVGCDVDQEAPVLYLRLAGAAVKRGAHLINAGVRHTKLDAQAKSSLRYRPGTAPYLALGLLASVLKQGLTDQNLISERLQGFDEVVDKMSDFSVAAMADVCGVSAEAIDAAAKVVAEADNSVILFGLEGGNDPALRLALENIALLTGHAGKTNNGLIPVLPHANSRGALDMGLLPDRLPGYVPIEQNIGLSAQEMLSGGVKGMLIAGADPAAESDAYKTALGQLDFLVVQELFLTETAQLADVILPAKGTAERDGTYTNLERRVQAFDPGVPPPGQARADWLISTSIAGALGAPWGYASADGVMAEITREVPLYAAMDFKNLTAPISLERKTDHYIYEGMSFTADAREGLQWPTLLEQSAEKIQLRFAKPAPVNGEQADLHLVTPRFLYDDGRLMDEADVIQVRKHQPKVLLSSADAKRLGLNPGDMLTVSQNGTAVKLPVQVHGLLEEGVVLVPRNLAGHPAEKLTGADQVHTPIKVEKS